MITVETWPISRFQQEKASGTLIVSPEYQRRPVWALKDQMLLMDSVARGVPMGAITLYVDSDQGFDTFEVIDGKQRLTAILHFLEDRYCIKTSAIEGAAVDDDEFDIALDDVVKMFHDALSSELDLVARMRILQYQVPVFLVRGERAAAIRSFSRMNRNPYALRPQEIRNAFYCDSAFLETVIQLLRDLDIETSGAFGSSTDSLLVKLGAISRSGWDRMQDLQFVSELLVLLLSGPQHRRDSLDQHYSLYRRPSKEAQKALGAAADRLKAIILQIWAITGGTSLQAFHFPASCENDIYALVGAFADRGLLSAPQLSQLQGEILLVVSEFRQQTELFIETIRSGEPPSPEEFEPLVEEYGRGFLGGQANSKNRRETRIKVWTEVINGVCATLDAKSGFTETQRRLIWARSSDKLCARCGKPVSWDEYHAGHTQAWSLGGRTTVENGRVEHASCNQSAGATS